MSDSSSDGTSPGARPRSRLTVPKLESREDDAPTSAQPRDAVRDAWHEEEAGLPPATDDEFRAEVETDLVSSLNAETRHERSGRHRSRPARVTASPLQARYREARTIGQGGMSTIHRVTDEVVGRRVAVVPIHDLCIEDGERAPYFTMKLVEGRTLSEVICRDAQAPLSPRLLDELLEIFLRVCDAVADAHTRGVVHRDLKPENIMVGSHGQVYVMDWGVARVLPGWFPTQSFPAGVVIVEEGAAGDAAFIIVTGTSDVVKAEPGGPRLVKQLGPGEVFGAASVFSGRPRTASVVATSEVTVKRVTRDVLRLELGGRDWLRARSSRRSPTGSSRPTRSSGSRAERP